jgi:hypothetical protein
MPCHHDSKTERKLYWFKPYSVVIGFSEGGICCICKITRNFPVISGYFSLSSVRLIFRFLLSSIRGTDKYQYCV